jgi:putative DNA primase/helicase
VPKEAQENQETEDSLPYDYVEQDPEYLDYLAELATKEMEAAYLPDSDEYEKMRKLCDEIAMYNSKAVALRSNKEINDSSEAIEAEFLDEDYTFYDSNAEYNQYLDAVHNKTLAEILVEIEQVDLINTLRFKIEDNLEKYLNQYGQVEELEVPNKLYIVAIIFELKNLVDKHGWGFAYEGNSLYVYTKSYWQRITVSKLKRFLNIAAMKLGFYSPADATTDSFVTLLLKQYQSQVPLYETPDSKNTVLVNLKNGTFEVNSKGIKFREHRKNDFIKHQLPYKYDKNEKAPIFKKYLDRVLPDKESQLILQEFHGYIFTRHLKLHKALILYGTGANGKSVMYEITTALLGKENVSTKSFGDLIDGDSGNANRASLQDKLLNFGSEIGAKKNMTLDIFKKLVSGEVITARQKYEKSIEIDGYCKFIFNANTLPDVKENTDAYYRRLLILPYNQRILEEEQDPELEQKIISNELPGIFNWTLEGLERLLKAKTGKRFSDCKASDDVIEEYKILSNSIALFLEAKGLTPDHQKENKITNQQIYITYEEWRKASGEEKISGSELSKRLQSMDFISWKSNGVRGLYMNGNIG